MTIYDVESVFVQVALFTQNQKDSLLAGNRRFMVNDECQKPPRFPVSVSAMLQ